MICVAVSGEEEIEGNGKRATGEKYLRTVIPVTDDQWLFAFTQQFQDAFCHWLLAEECYADDINMVVLEQFIPQLPEETVDECGAITCSCTNFLFPCSISRIKHIVEVAGEACHSKGWEKFSATLGGEAVLGPSVSSLCQCKLKVGEGPALLLKLIPNITIFFNY